MVLHVIILVGGGFGVDRKEQTWNALRFDSWLGLSGQFWENGGSVDLLRWWGSCWMGERDEVKFKRRQAR
ncbi:MAG: hypothetical protein EBV00_07080 [Burkholderiaceae bacterium]|nr:hypothetical protein [Burkholderiaceae bacterium]